MRVPYRRLFLYASAMSGAFEAADGGNDTALANDARFRILKAAEILFIESGFVRTSMDAIAARARISKRTLYAEFKDKRAILEAVLNRFITWRLQAITSICQQSSDARSTLIAIAQGLADAALAPEANTMLRLLISEADQLPALAERANEHGLAESLELMREPLARLGVSDSAMAGRMIYDLVVLAPGHRALLREGDSQIAVEQVIDVILRGFTHR